MRKSIIALVLALMPGLAFAQEGERGPGRMGPQGGFPAMLLEQREVLKLTTDQVTRLEALAAEHSEKHAAMRASMQSHRATGERPARMSAEQRQAMRAQMDAMRTTMRASMEAARAVLSTEQEGKVDAMIEERRAERRPGMHRRPGVRGREDPHGRRDPRGEPTPPTQPPIDGH